MISIEVNSSSCHLFLFIRNICLNVKGLRILLSVMYQEFVVCNVPGNCITNAKISTIFYFKSVSTWQEEPTAHVRSALGFMGYDTQGMFVMAFNSYDTNSVCTVITTNVILDYLYLFYAVYLRTIFLVKFNSSKELVHFC